MKLLALVTLLLSASLAQAKEILIMDLNPTTFHGRSYSHGVDASFAINKEMGRAWVKLVVTEDVTYSQSPRQYFETKVPGLFYEESSRLVVLEHEGKRFECANVVYGRILGQRIKPTGQCRFSHRYVKVPYDDGYRTGTALRLHVFLNVAD